jgi:hypothetical protein
MCIYIVIKFTRFFVLLMKLKKPKIVLRLLNNSGEMGSQCSMLEAQKLVKVAFISSCTLENILGNVFCT